MRHTISTSEASAIHKARAKAAEAAKLDREAAEREAERQELEAHQSAMELRYKTQ